MEKESSASADNEPSPLREQEPQHEPFTLASPPIAQSWSSSSADAQWHPKLHRLLDAASPPSSQTSLQPTVPEEGRADATQPSGRSPLGNPERSPGDLLEELKRRNSVLFGMLAEHKAKKRHLKNRQANLDLCKRNCRN